MFQYLPGRFLPVMEIGGHACPDSEGLGGRVDADKNDIVFSDAPFDVGAEEKILTPCLFYNLCETRLIDGETVRVPRLDSLCIGINHRHPAMGALVGDNSHRWSAYVTGAYTEDIFFNIHDALSYNLAEVSYLSLNGL